MRMRVCYLDCHETGLYRYLVIQKTYFIHYSCFTSICDLFTDSPSYILLLLVGVVVVVIVVNYM
jgi:hypothetical protein